MKQSNMITTLDGAVGHLRDQIENFEEAVGSAAVDPSHRSLLAMHVDAMLEAQKVLEQEVAILGVPPVEVIEEISAAENDLEGAFGHLRDQVDNLEETIGSNAVRPAERGILALQVDAIREASVVLENETRKVDREQGEAVTDVALLSVHLDEAQVEIARATREAQNTREAIGKLITTISDDLYMPLEALVRNVRVGCEDLAKGELPAKDQLEHWSRIEETGSQLLAKLEAMLGPRRDH